MNPPFKNCRYSQCDLPGQCIDDGECHHPKNHEELVQSGTLYSDKELLERVMMYCRWRLVNDHHHRDGSLEAIVAQIFCCGNNLAVGLIKRFSQEKHEGSLVGDKYNELIMAVAKKHPGETRHETALRYINERESQQSSEDLAKYDASSGLLSRINEKDD